MTEVESISVAVRIRPRHANASRPQSKREITTEWEASGESTVINTRTRQSFTFDYVFGEDSDTSTVYRLLAYPLVQKTVQGLNASIFAYGQTCSGKTFTMRGNDRSPGIIVLALREIFRGIPNQLETEFMVRVSFLEVYNEMVNDLLRPGNTNLDVRESLEKGVYIDSLSEFTVASEEEALQLLYAGDQLRKTGGTLMNLESSRSHSLFRITLEVQSKDLLTISHLNLVDLAGSEGVQKTGAEEGRLREGSNINKSLLSLSTVIQKLSEASSRGLKFFINYRDSKLTRILQPSLSGNSRTGMICNITPSSYTETLNTLLFGAKAKHIKTQAKVNTVVSSAQSMLSKTTVEIDKLRAVYQHTQHKLTEAQTELERVRLELSQKDSYIAGREDEAALQVCELQDKLDAAERRIKELDSRVLRSAEKPLRTPASANRFSAFDRLDGTVFSRMQELEHELENERAEFTRLQKDYEERYQEKVLEIETISQSLNGTEDSALRAENTQLRASLQSAQEALQSLQFVQDEAESALKTVASLQLKGTQDAQELERLRGELLSVQGQVQVLGQQRDEEGSRRRRLEEQLETAELDFKAKTSQSAAPPAEQTESIAALQSQLDRALQSRERVVLKLYKKTRAYEACKQRIDSLEQTIQRHQADSQQASQAHLQLELKFTEKSKQFTDLQRQLQGAEALSELLKDEKYLAEQELLSVQLEKEQLEESSGQLKEQYQRLSDELTTQIVANRQLEDALQTGNPRGEVWAARKGLSTYSDLNCTLMQRNQDISDALTAEQEKRQAQKAKCMRHVEDYRVLQRSYEECSKQLAKLKQNANDEEVDRVQVKCHEYLELSEQALRARSTTLKKLEETQSELHNAKLKTIDNEERILKLLSAKMHRHMETQGEVKEHDL
jgi:centromeric protein E